MELRVTGTDDEALLLDFSGRSVSATHYPMYIRDYGLGLLVVDTQVPHGDVRPLFESRRTECAAAAHALLSPYADRGGQNC